MGTRSTFPGGKAANAWSPTHFQLVLMLKMSRGESPLPICLYGMQIGSFTLTCYWIWGFNVIFLGTTHTPYLPPWNALHTKHNSGAMVSYNGYVNVLAFVTTYNPHFRTV